MLFPPSPSTRECWGGWGAVPTNDDLATRRGGGSTVAMESGCPSLASPIACASLVGMGKIFQEKDFT
jgi:hypothetical protein